ncbi:MAG: hypothetical protein F6K50_17375 [Moorea sp. SIO3I7]|uniref:hypothetical protein n=1 Tax=unclassified Moorena TaxID=2683338 RepID=UPI0013C20F91|nr:MULTISPECIES: hypothetical protein [unclassified Moorena]NEN97234.1 hypothetical protein [Moorena sp. SIO3I7]NEO09837.1 hypothetical protein [Moorena sp. SIO3I8]NEP25178.1 hypothetical protein [Moorena sp. SIO3I6]
MPIAYCLLPLACSAVWDDINTFVEWASCLFPLGASQCMLFEPVVRYGTDCPNTGY